MMASLRGCVHQRVKLLLKVWVKEVWTQAMLIQGGGKGKVTSQWSERGDPCEKGWIFVLRDVYICLEHEFIDNLGQIFTPACEGENRHTAIHVPAWDSVLHQCNLFWWIPFRQDFVLHQRYLLCWILFHQDFGLHRRCLFWWRLERGISGWIIIIIHLKIRVYWVLISQTSLCPTLDEIVS